jgi:hypothetical protein
MYQLTQLAADRHHQRLAAAEAQRPAQRALALARATRRARIRRPAPRPGRLAGALSRRPQDRRRPPLDCCLRAWAGNTTSDLKEEANGHDH